MSPLKRRGPEQASIQIDPEFEKEIQNKGGKVIHEDHPERPLHELGEQRKKDANFFETEPPKFHQRPTEAEYQRVFEAVVPQVEDEEDDFDGYDED